MVKKLNIRLLIICVLMVLLCNVGVSFALFLDRSDGVINSFELGSVSCEIDETFDGVVKENVGVKNTSDVSVFVRSMVVVSWMSEDKVRVYSSSPELGEDYTISFNDEDWFKGSDGFYYYKNKVNSGKVTESLVYEAKLKEGVKPPEGYKLSIEIISSAVQANPDRAVSEVWKVVEYSGTELVSVS